MAVRVRRDADGEIAARAHQVDEVDGVFELRERASGSSGMSPPSAMMFWTPASA